MLLNRLRQIHQHGAYNFGNGRHAVCSTISTLRNKAQVCVAEKVTEDEAGSRPQQAGDMVPTSPSRLIPIPVTGVKDLPVLPFDEVPGPKSLKFLSNFRHYFSSIGTQVMANILTFGLNVGGYIFILIPVTCY